MGIKLQDVDNCTADFLFWTHIKYVFRSSTRADFSTNIFTNSLEFFVLNFDTYLFIKY